MANSGESEGIIATREHAGRTCPYCRFPLKQDGELVVCGHCRAAHHADCWSDNRGCAVMGCLGGPAANTSTEQPTMAMPPPLAYTGQASAGPGLVPPGMPPPQWPPSPGRSGWSSNKGLAAAVAVLALAVGGVGVAIALTNQSTPANAASATGNTGNAGSASSNTGNTGNTGSTSSNTGNTGNTGSTSSNTGNTGNTGSTSSNTGNTGSTGLPNHCSRGVDATQSISCGLASNVFYEYYTATQAGGTATTLSAWSSATKKYYDVSCSPGAAVVTCTISGATDPNAEVDLTQSALSAYSPQQASTYTANADVGPNG
jgi:hypothetical protein